MKFASFIIALIIMLPLSVIGTLFSHIYYAMLIITSGFVIVRGLLFKDLKFDLNSVLFLFVGFLSLIFNDVAPYNNAWLRFGGFFMLMLAFGTLNKSDFSVEMKRNILRYSKIVIPVLTVLSFFAYILQLSFAFNKGVSGVFNHSMALSPVAAISALICFDEILYTKKAILRKQKIFSILLFFCSLFTSMLAASRGAILALIIGIVASLIYKYKKSRRKLVFSIITVSITGFAVVTYNPMAVLDGLIHKMDKTTAQMLSGRDAMWEDRVTDFKSSPLIGVGFSSFKEISNSKIDLDEGSQESGSSWFFILGSMGLSGILIYILLLFMPVVKAWKNNLDVGLNIAIVFFFIVHTAIEGYSVAFGNSLCCIMWLNIGVLNSYFLKSKI